MHVVHTSQLPAARRESGGLATGGVNGLARFEGSASTAARSGGESGPRAEEALSREALEARDEARRLSNFVVSNDRTSLVPRKSLVPRPSRTSLSPASTLEPAGTGPRGPSLAALAEDLASAASREPSVAPPSSTTSSEAQRLPSLPFAVRRALDAASRDSSPSPLEGAQPSSRAPEGEQPSSRAPEGALDPVEVPASAARISVVPSRSEPSRHDSTSLAPAAGEAELGEPGLPRPTHDDFEDDFFETAGGDERETERSIPPSTLSRVSDEHLAEELPVPEDPAVVARRSLVRKRALGVVATVVLVAAVFGVRAAKRRPAHPPVPAEAEHSAPATQAVLRLGDQAAAAKEPAPPDPASEPENTEAEALKREARTLLLSAHYRAAIEVAERAVAAAPDDAETYLFLGAGLQETGQWVRAAGIFKQCSADAQRGPRDECRALARH